MIQLSLNDLPLVIACAAFSLMGAGALIMPSRVTRQFGMPDLSAAGRSEVRAVYGGYGLAMAACLIACLFAPVLKPGVCLTLAAALGGMAVGRAVSAIIDRTLPRLPALYLLLEAGMAGLLLYPVLSVQA